MNLLTKVIILIIGLLLTNLQAVYATEKLGNPFDVKVATAKKGELGVPINLSAGLSVKKVKRKLVSTYYPINVTVSDFKAYDFNYDYRGDAIGYVPRYGYTLTVKNFNKSQEVVGVYTQLWCRNSINYADNWTTGFSGYQSLPPRTESSGTTITSLPLNVTSLKDCEQALIYIFPNYSFTPAQVKTAKFPTSVVIPIDQLLVN